MVDTGICKAFTLVQVRGPPLPWQRLPTVWRPHTKIWALSHAVEAWQPFLLQYMRPLFCLFFFKYSFNGATSAVIKRQQDSATYFLPESDEYRNVFSRLSRQFRQEIYRGCGPSSGFLFLFRYSPGLLRRGCIRPLTSQIERLRVIIAIVHQLLFEARSANWIDSGARVHSPADLATKLSRKWEKQRTWVTRFSGGRPATMIYNFRIMNKRRGAISQRRKQKWKIVAHLKVADDKKLTRWTIKMLLPVLISRSMITNKNKLSSVFLVFSSQWQFHLNATEMTSLQIARLFCAADAKSYVTHRRRSERERERVQVHHHLPRRLDC